MKVSCFLFLLLLGDNPSGGMPLTTSIAISRLYKLNPVGLRMIYMYLRNPYIPRLLNTTRISKVSDDLSWKL